MEGGATDATLCVARRREGYGPFASRPKGGDVDFLKMIPASLKSRTSLGIPAAARAPRALASAGAELVFCPAVTFGSKSERLWDMEFPVDAARHGVVIGGSNRKGVEPPWEQPYFGKTHFVGPNGPIPNVSRHPHLVLADLDLGELTANDPSGWNLPRDIRHGIYSPRK